MNSRTLTLAALTTAVVALSAHPAAAQTAEQKATAQAMFDQAKELMTKGSFAEACKRFEESQRLDAGMATEFRLAECYEKAGRLASAWTSYVDVADQAKLAKLADRERVARQRADALKPQLPTLVIVVPGSIASTPGLEVLRDKVPVGSAQWGAPLPVDPGTHEVVVRATGKQPWSGSVVSQAGKKAELQVSLGADAPPAQAATAAPAPVASQPTPEPTPAPASSGSSRGTVGLVLAAAGVVGVGAGIGVGLAAKGKFDGTSSQCAGDLCPDSALAARNSAMGMGNIATALFIGGAAVAVGGGVLWLTAPSSKGTTAAAMRVELGPGGVTARGVW